MPFDTAHDAYYILKRCGILPCTPDYITNNEQTSKSVIEHNARRSNHWLLLKCQNCCNWINTVISNKGPKPNHKLQKSVVNYISVGDIDATLRNQPDRSSQVNKWRTIAIINKTLPSLKMHNQVKTRKERKWKLAFLFEFLYVNRGVGR